ncbi:MAG TPA: KpsF/GutQ family sugar-phosphate isomerase, partial [Bdellovibrionales bacterium]|nr:KpsF/GutQ family sugar-phosphate isomerase [Bdellovibrionales bacterium]
VMTVRPATITPQELARTALDLMENRPSQISVLPVVDTDGNWEGLVRVHDLAKQF